MKVFIVGGNPQYVRMFIKHGWDVAESRGSSIRRIQEADLIQFTGGEDVTPSIYGEKNTASHNNEQRDLEEAGYFAIARRMGKPMAGICRGGQFLNVMCGGSMIQHVEGHATGKTHDINDHDNYFRVTKKIQVTSTHHQMMVEGDGATTIATANIVNNDDDYDLEVCTYNNGDSYWEPQWKVLCFQPHPEFDGYKECTDYYFELLDRCLGLKV